ncbi:MAG TPA: phosphoribosylformylglycinamidine synthase [Clostridiales bacterium]|nr:phosphoribosylformylglycinamidine synthase [Clostridiales bacterium]
MVRRIFVETKNEYDVESQQLYEEITGFLGIENLKSVKVFSKYDIQGITDQQYLEVRNRVLSEPPINNVYEENTGFEEHVMLEKEIRIIAMEYLPGQYDQKADITSQCIQIIIGGPRPIVKTARIIVLKGKISDVEFSRIKNYYINPVESKETSLEKLSKLDSDIKEPDDIKILEGFINVSDSEIEEYGNKIGFAMPGEDLLFCRDYFKNQEKRDPTMTEIKVLDTYWSDHCRHTTFMTRIQDIEFDKGPYYEVINRAFQEYLKSREYVYSDKPKDICLMDLATINMKEQRKRGLLEDLEVSEEVNASSITVSVDVEGMTEEWLVMFKNETHNHPTEIEPFGGAATCLGGGIRDPLSGRAYVYQAMRITGSGDPRTKIEDTLPGKLPQRKITTTAAAGYSSYGNQIGISSGHLSEIYDEGFVAKRMELGAVIGAAPKRNVVRENPCTGDVIILLGGRTGRDGCGGATGSSKEHTEESLLTSGAEVQKGNPLIERNILRMFRKPEVSRMIKRCNDFGAGGVSVAIGELADGLDINLDKVPVKYAGLNGTELAISESQERMAVMVSKENEARFIEMAAEENLEATTVAVVTEEPRLKIRWRGKTIVDLSREFLNSSGIRKNTNVKVLSPVNENNYFFSLPYEIDKSLEAGDIEKAWMSNLKRLNICSQKGLMERFDSTVGGDTVLMPMGGKYQLSPAEGMVARIPVLEGETSTATVMTYGYNPSIGNWSPFHGALYSIVEAVAKVAAIGGDYKKIRLSLQEYFERLGSDPEKWGKPFVALLGAYYAQKNLGLPSIGGKDSMSGTFENIHVPPTVVAFAVNTLNINSVISTEFKKAGSKVICVPLRQDKNNIPDFEGMGKNYAQIHELIKTGKVLASSTVKEGGLAAAVSKMCFGNKIGFALSHVKSPQNLFAPDYGSIVLELDNTGDLTQMEQNLQGLDYYELGTTIDEQNIIINNVVISLDKAISSWELVLNDIFPVKTEKVETCAHSIYDSISENKSTSELKAGNFTGRAKLGKTAKPLIFIPVFHGTSGEYEAAQAFEKAGGTVDTFVFRSLTGEHIKQSIDIIEEKINNSQILMLPGGLSGDLQLGGSGRYMAAVLGNPYIKDAINRLLNERHGLILGLGIGFQALLKLGLLPYGEFREMNESSPTLAVNINGNFVSRMVWTKVTSTMSPWFANTKAGDIHLVPIACGEGRFVAGTSDIELLAKNGQIASTYVTNCGSPACDTGSNPTGSMNAIDGITSPDGRILGMVTHPERIDTNTALNVPGNKEQKIFEAGVKYFGW